MFGICLLSLVVAVVASPPVPLTPKIDNVSSESNENYLLPTTTLPSKYQITLTVPAEVLSGRSTAFTGSVNITFQVTQSTNEIRLHSLVNITNISIFTSTENASIPIMITNHTEHFITETVTILLPTNLTVNASYNLEIQYSGVVDPKNMQGLYRSKYVTNGTMEYLVTTQFQATYARSAFPCFDEPQYKANFELTLIYPAGYEAVSNTPVAGYITTTNTTVTRTFQQTPLMSTYLLAFTISKFTCTSNETGGVPLGVCSRTDFAADRTLALEYGVKILDTLNAWTNFSYNQSNIGKMDQFAIPDFSAGAMENWGMVTYREYMLLWNEEHSSKINTQQILSVIAHEFTHMWFGNLITTKWWNTTFLNEGFARYFQYFILNQLSNLQSYQMDQQFIINVQQQAAFPEDSSLFSESLTSDAWNPDQIRKKFGSITYNKGASIIRMIENLIGTSSFQTALQQYISTNAFQPSTPDLLWNAFANVVSNGILPVNVTFPQFIDNWANKAGFPVISAKVNGNNVILTQKRFLYNDTDGTQWYVPIIYALPNGTVVSTWLEPNGSITLNNVVSNNNWIIVNHNSKGYYRVNYDNTLRQKIIDALQSNHTQFSDLNKAQIIDDAFNLAQAGHIKYSDAFKLLDYLKNETSYYPWYAAIRGLNYLSKRIGNSSALGQRINRMVLELIDNVSANVSSTNWTTTGHVDALRLQMVWNVACRRGQQSCLSEVLRLFREFRVNETSINANLRETVYCNALRYSTDINTDWTFLWNRLNSIDQPHENLYILSTLGCTTNKDYLTTLLEQSLNSTSVIRNQDFATVWSSVYATSSVGLELAFDHFTSNYSTILEYYSTAATIFNNIVTLFTTDDQVQKLQQFVNQLDKNSSIITVAESALFSARQNLQWQSDLQDDLNQYFGISTSSASTFGVTLYLLLLVVFFI